MAKKPPPPPPSKTSSLLPLLITALLLLIGAAVAYAVYAVAASVAEQTGRKMERRNVVVTRGGMKVGIKEVGSEREADRTQRYGFLCPLLHAILGRMDWGDGG